VFNVRSKHPDQLFKKLDGIKSLLTRLAEEASEHVEHHSQKVDALSAAVVQAQAHKEQSWRVRDDILKLLG
jgi:predicted YcjX-like family ATPase